MNCVVVLLATLSFTDASPSARTFVATPPLYAIAYPNNWHAFSHDGRDVHLESPDALAEITVRVVSADEAKQIKEMEFGSEGASVETCRADNRRFRCVHYEDRRGENTFLAVSRGSTVLAVFGTVRADHQTDLKMILEIISSLRVRNAGKKN
jgi:hypothetical protein